MENTTSNQTLNQPNSSDSEQIVIFSLIPVNQTPVDTQTDSNNKVNSTPLAYYDSVSKKIITINNNIIRIYNKKGTCLKKEFKLELINNSIRFVSVDDELSYITMLINNERTYKFVVVNIKTVIAIEVKMEEDTQFILGSFFIDKSKEFQIDSNEKPAEFVVIYIDRFEVYQIKNNKTKLLNNVKLSNRLIKYYRYNSKFKVLSLLTNTNEFKFFNFLYQKNYNYCLSFIPNCFKELNLNKSDCLFQSKKDTYNEMKRIIENYYCKDRYIDLQFFLPDLYNQLYLIVFLYENNMINFYHIEALNKIVFTRKLEFKKHNHCSSLQFVDNLILVHNFITKNIKVIDIKYKDYVIFSSNTEFPYENNAFINEEIFEERNKNNNGSINLYMTKFNLEYFKECVINKEITNRLNTEEIDLELIKVILYRKKSTTEILDVLYSMLVKKFDSENLITILELIIDSIKNNNNKMLFISQYLENQNNPKPVESKYDLVDVTYDKFLKDQGIKQKDLYHYFFQKLIDNELSDKIILDSLFYLSFIYKSFKDRFITIEEKMFQIFSDLVAKLKNKELLINTIFTSNIPLSCKLADYLMNESNQNNNRLLQKGLDIYLKNKKFDIIIDYLLKNQKIEELFLFIKKYSNNFSKSELNVLLKNANVLRCNKQLIRILVK